MKLKVSFTKIFKIQFQYKKNMVWPHFCHHKICLSKPFQTLTFDDEWCNVWNFVFHFSRHLIGTLKQPEAIKLITLITKDVKNIVGWLQLEGLDYKSRPKMKRSSMQIILYLLLFNNPKTFSASQTFEGELSPPEICLRRAWHSPSTPGTEPFISSQESHNTYRGQQCFELAITINYYLHLIVKHSVMFN